jgi:hypothetical protein
LLLLLPAWRLPAASAAFWVVAQLSLPRLILTAVLAVQNPRRLRHHHPEVGE